MLHVLQCPRPTVSPTEEALEKRVPIYVDVADPMRSLQWNSKQGHFNNLIQKSHEIHVRFTH